MVSTLTFASKITRPIIFSAVKNVSFPQSRNFSTVKEILYSQEIFPQPRKLSTVKKLFYSEGIFPQSKNFSTKNFYLIKEIFTNKDMFYSQ